MDVDSEIAPTLQEMTKRMAVIRNELLPALQQLDEDAVVSFYSVDEQARLYLSAAFTLALSLYSLDKITHRTAPAGAAGGARLTGAGPRSAAPTTSSADTQLVLKIERITEYIKKLQELAALERTKKAAAAAAAAEDGGSGTAAREKRPREVTETAPDAVSPPTAAKKAKTEPASTPDESAGVEDEYGDAQMFSVVSRVAGETGTLVSRLLKQVMANKAE